MAGVGQCMWHLPLCVALPACRLSAVAHPGAIQSPGAAASRLADIFFALRCWPHPRVPSVGAPALGPDVVEKGFGGQANHAARWQTSGAQVLPRLACTDLMH